jgi:hypothetical protein
MELNAFVEPVDGCVGLMCECTVGGKPRRAWLSVFSEELYRGQTRDFLLPIVQDQLRAMLQCPELELMDFTAINPKPR